jgi:formamidopyrimidine-DNA glycosylase
MPEMPELETIKRDLEKKVKGKKIERVIIKNKKFVKMPTPSEFIHLMDQKFMAGIGNIYSQEALFLSQIHPERIPSSLANEEIEKLYKNLQQILKKAISYRGSSVDAYVDLEGKKGNFEPQLKVYGREGKPCFKCGATIKRIEVSGRGTYFCPNCQG